MFTSHRCVILTATPVWFHFNEGGRSNCSPDERYHRGCWLSQGDLENSTIGEWELAEWKSRAIKSTPSNVGHSPVKHLRRHFKSTNILCFILHFLLLLRSLLRHSSLLYGEMLHWLTCSFQSICLFLSHPFPICHFSPFFFLRLWIPAECGSVSISGNKTWKFSKGSSAV